MILFTFCSCEKEDPAPEVYEPSDVQAVALQEDVYPGLTLLLDDGTVISSKDLANKMANSSGAYVQYNGGIVTDYCCDVTHLGTTNLEEKE